MSRRKRTSLLLCFSLSCLCFAPRLLSLASSDQACCSMTLFHLLHPVLAVRSCLWVQLLLWALVTGRSAHDPHPQPLLPYTFRLYDAVNRTTHCY